MNQLCLDDAQLASLHASARGFGMTALVGERQRSILRSHDLPFSGAFQPRVGPNQTMLCLLAIFSLGDRAFRSIRYRDSVAEKSHLYLTQLAVA